MTSKTLKEYLAHYGLMTCNSTPAIPNITDLGFHWSDVTRLIDNQELFYCKAYKNRTTYLSPEVYYLLKTCKKQKPMSTESQEIYQLLQNNAMETSELKAFSFMKQSTYKNAFDFLLKERYITAIQNGRFINPNWSTFVYTATPNWETHTPDNTPSANPTEQLTAILQSFMTEKEVGRFLK